MLPISHLTPVKPTGQLQNKCPLLCSSQTPPFRH